MNNNSLNNLNEIRPQNVTFSIVLDKNLSNEAFEAEIEGVTLNIEENKKKKNVRLIYCSDGILEECEEDEIEKERLEKEERERIIEQRKQLEIEAVNSEDFFIFHNILKIEAFKNHFLENNGMDTILRLFYKKECSKRF